MRAAEVQEAVTRRIAEWIKKNQDVPWRKPWDVRTGRPRSMSTGKHYQGTNIWILTIAALDKGYASPWWGTYDKIAELSGMTYDTQRKRWVSPDGTDRGIRKGEKNTTIYVWDVKTYPDPDFPDDRDQDRTVFYAKAWRMFNAEQADQLPERYYAKVTDREIENLPGPEAVMARYLESGPQFKSQGNSAHYDPAADVVTVPDSTQFHAASDFYVTVFHELVHSTGHQDRLNREGVAQFDHFGSGQYGREELVAQMGAAILAAMTGLDAATFDNSAAYIQGWLKAIRGDATLLPKAAKLAQEAADLIMGEE